MIYRNNRYGPIDRFCAKHPRFGIPNLMVYIIGIRIVVFLVDMFTQHGASFLLNFYGLGVLSGEVWRMVTFVFTPFTDNPFFFLLGCYVSFWTSRMLEREWGSAKFTLFYCSGVILSSVAALLLGLLQPIALMVFMSLAPDLEMSIFLIIATLYGEMQILLFFVVPIKMKWSALIDILFVLVSSIQLLQRGLWSLALLPIATFLNYFIFTWSFWKVKLGLARSRRDPKVVNFRRAQKVAKVKEAQGYRHKCAVCGITDQDDPDMEFRYCSKCDGYYCYCANHINNHIHIHRD